MAKNKNDYFKLIEQQVEFCVKASDFLTDCLNNCTAEQIPEKRDEMHAIEHAADQQRHDIMTKLSSEFITPIDQEDIIRLVQIIDDVTDALDEVVLEFYMFDIQNMPEFAPEFSKIVNKCVKGLYSAVQELKNFKKPDTLRKLLVEVNMIEGEADDLFVNAIHQLYRKETTYKELSSNKEVYESLENCCDLCEHAADVIEQVVMKNT